MQIQAPSNRSGDKTSLLQRISQPYGNGSATAPLYEYPVKLSSFSTAAQAARIDRIHSVKSGRISIKCEIKGKTMVPKPGVPPSQSLEVGFSAQRSRCLIRPEIPTGPGGRAFGPAHPRGSSGVTVRPAAPPEFAAPCDALPQA